MINGLWETGDGPIKTFPLRGIKDSPIDCGASKSWRNGVGADMTSLLGSPI
jgi:hypothetical protein